MFPRSYGGRARFVELFDGRRPKTLIRLVLKPGRTVSVERRHPWLFSGAVARKEGDGSDGAAEILGPDGRRLAAGAYSEGSRIVARLWTFGEEAPPPSAALFAERFAAARRLREALLPAETTGFRAVNSEGDLCPGVTLDAFQEIGVLDLAVGGTERWEPDLSETARRTFGLERVLVRAEVEAVVGHRPPQADGLVRLAGVRVEQVLEERRGGAGDVGVGDGHEVVVHREAPGDERGV